MLRWLLVLPAAFGLGVLAGRSAGGRQSTGEQKRDRHDWALPTFVATVFGVVAAFLGVAVGSIGVYIATHPTTTLPPLSLPAPEVYLSIDVAGTTWYPLQSVDGRRGWIADTWVRL